MDDGYFSEELELRDQHDLADESDDDSRSERSLGSRDTADESADDDDGDILEPTEEHYQILRSTVVEILSAMGGLEEVEAENGDIESVYVMGDDVLRCLRDLRTLWREDEEDQSRLIPRIFAEVSVMQNGLIPLLLKSAGMGEKGGKIALACTDLMMSMTWPIDTNAELKAAVERNASDERLRTIAKLSTLEQALVAYKAAVLRISSAETRGGDKDVLSSVVLYVLLPALSKPRPLRSERDIGTISLCLHFFRNLLAIRDPPATTLSSAEAISMAQLQSELVVAMGKAHILDTILTIASSADQRDLEPWSAVAAECIYFIFAGTRLAVLVPGSSEAKQLAHQETEVATLAGRRATMNATAAGSAESREKMSALSATLNAEAKAKRSQLLTSGSSRHSRFGTSINFTGSDGQKRVARTQAALRKTSEQLMLEAQEKYRRKNRRKAQMQEKGAPVIRIEWSRAARAVLVDWTNRFMRLAFETLTLSLFEDIAKERAKMGNLDEARVRLMYLLGFFLDYFMLQRQVEQAKLAALKRTEANKPLSHSMAANAAQVAPANDKGKARAIDEPEQQADAEAAKAAEVQQDFRPAPASEPKATWTFDMVRAWLDPKLMRLAVMRTSKAMEDKHRLEVATAVHLWLTALRLIDLLAQSPSLAEREAAEGIQVAVYHKGDTLQIFKEFIKSYSAQSFEYLDAVVALAYLQPKMLERFSSNKEALYIKAKARVKKAKAIAAVEGIDHDVVDVEKAVKQDTEDMYKERRFEFQKFQSEMISAPLVRACVTHLRRWANFHEPVEQLSHVLAVMHRFAVKASRVEVFFPSDIRTNLRDIAAGPMVTSLEARAPTQTADAKKLIDYILRRFNKLSEQEKLRYADGQRMPRAPKAYKIPAEFKIDPSQGHMNDIGIAVALLTEKQKLPRVMWVRQALETAASMRRSTQPKPVDGGEERAMTPDSDAEDSGAAQRRRGEPLVWEAHLLDYDGDDTLRSDATLMPELKLLCRLVGFASDESDPYGWKWSIPGDVSPDILEADAEYVTNYIRDPYQSGGTDLKEYIKRIIRRNNTGQARRAVVSGDESSDYGSDAATDEGEGGETNALQMLKKKRERTHRRLNPAAKKRPPAKRFVQEDDLIDSDEEMAVAEAGWKAKHDALSSQRLASSQMTSSSNARSADGGDGANDSDASSVRPERRARPKATAVARQGGARSSGSSSPEPSDARSSPPTSSPALMRSPPVVKNKRRANAGLFLRGDDEEEDEEDQLDSDAESDVRPLGRPPAALASPPAERTARSRTASASPSPSPADASNFTGLKRSLLTRQLDSDSDEEASQNLSSTSNQLRKTRPALVDDDEEDELAAGQVDDEENDEMQQSSKRRKTMLAIFSDDDE